MQDPKIILGKILKRFTDNKEALSIEKKRFAYIRETDNAVWVSREDGEDTRVPFDKLLTGIEAYQENVELYHKGPSALREFKITHVTSPVWALLHLMEKEEFL